MKTNGTRFMHLPVGFIAGLAVAYVFLSPAWTSNEYQSNNLKSAKTTDEVASPLKQTRAVVHMGIHKTGTSSIQSQSLQYSAQLKKDGYEMPWVVYKHLWGGAHIARDTIIGKASHNQVNFATCFLEPIDVDRPIHCAPYLLISGLEIAKRKSNIFISAETFDKIDETGIELLSQYLSNWDDTIVIVYYRRFYDWLGSKFNQNSKDRDLDRPATLPNWERSIVDVVTRSVTDVPKKYTFHFVQLLEKHFDNVVVMNMHDRSKNFYCDAMPYAHHTCEAIHNSTEEVHHNPRHDLIYSDLAYGAFKKGLIAIETNKKMRKVIGAVKEFNEVRLELTSNDFKMTCLLPETKKMLLEKSMEFEKTLFPEFFSSPMGEADLRSDFEKQVKSTLCKIDVDSVLGEVVWQDFFETLRE